MANQHSRSRRPAPLLSVGLFSAGAWLLAGRAGVPGFVSAPSATGRTPSRTALRGFKEDFDAWRSSLTAEEQSMIQTQAEGEFNKKFRKSDEFKKDLPEEKVKAFSKVLEKFFEAEGKDAEADDQAKTPDYEGLTRKASQGGRDFSLKNKIYEVDRDADRRYNFASQKIRAAQAKGELFPQSSPMHETWVIQNNDTKSHENAVHVLKWLEAAGKDPKCPEHLKPLFEKVVAKGIPEVGEHIEVLVPQVLSNQVMHLTQMLQQSVAAMSETKSKEEVDKIVKDNVPEIASRVIAHLTEKWASATTEVEQEVKTMKEFYRSQKDMPGKTKADVLKEIWEELPKHTDKPVPPLDEEMLAELAEEPAIIEGEFKHNWGTADRLYKSEAIDAFGMKYLLGVFETKDEAQKAFEDWNGEYEKARGEMKAELEQWGKQEQARLDRDTVGQERIKDVLANAKA